MAKSKADALFKAAKKLEAAQVKFANAKNALVKAEDVFEDVVEEFKYNDIEDTAYGEDDVYTEF